MTPNASKVFAMLDEMLYFSNRFLSQATGLPPVEISAAISELQELGLVISRRTKLRRRMQTGHRRASNRFVNVQRGTLRRCLVQASLKVMP